MATGCEHEWFAWARGRRSEALKSIYCGNCRVLLGQFIDQLLAENEALREHLAEVHACEHDTVKDRG